MGTVRVDSSGMTTVERDGVQVPFDVLPPVGDQREWLAADLGTADGLVALTADEWAQVPAYAERQREAAWRDDVAEHGYDAARAAWIREQ